MRSEMSDKQVLWMRTGIAALLISLAAAARIMPHPMNFAPIGAIALFGGATFKEKWMKFAFPLGALFAGDIFVGFHKLMLFVYASFFVNVIIGMWVEKNRGVARIMGATLAGAIQFFLVTNFAVWAVFITYPKNLAGLISCYAAGVPFFWNTLAGDALYAALLFGGYALAGRWLRQPGKLGELQG